MVDIILATYNGENYIAEQLDSILKQSVTDWHLYIQDDASTDGTVDIIKEFAQQYPDKVSYEVNLSNSGSPKSNFFALLKRTTADYVFTCDQDDIWKPSKLERTLDAFSKQDNKRPVLIHTDLTVIDEDKHILYSSMIQTQHIDVRRIKPNELVVQNVVTGCTMAMNRALVNILREPKELPVHDWWIAMVASLFGKIVYINAPTVYYRQHEDNICGAQDMDSNEYILERFRDKNRAKYMLSLGYVLAREIISCYGRHLSVANRVMLKRYGNMPRLNKLEKIRVLTTYHIWKSGIVRKLGQLLFM